MSIEDFTEFVDNWNYWDDPTTQDYQIENHLGTTDIAFSPSVISNAIVSVQATKHISFDVVTNYVGRQYIDNTASLERSLDPYFVNDALVKFSFQTSLARNIQFSARMNNVLDKMYVSNAWVYSYYYNNERGIDEGYFPQAGRNFMLNLTMKF